MYIKRKNEIESKSFAGVKEGFEDKTSSWSTTYIVLIILAILFVMAMIYKYGTQ